MNISFNGRIYQNRYSLEPINEIDGQYLREIKTICKKLQSKIVGERKIV